jgi:alkanesulfonate monooxygenase SsuD/methylene tetrahydromethanopterin reductase-like flavin-dependent oxidoreductase (luciferase family)
MIPFPPVMLAAVAARTSRIRLGTSVALLPLHHPLHLAESYAMLDQVSGGRLELGVGRGFVAYDYTTYGVPVEEGQARLLETLEVMLEAWQRQPFSYHGRFFQYDNVSVLPAPMQRPHPPVWIACTSNPEGFAWAGRQGFNLLTVSHVRTLDKLRESIDIYRQAAREAGHDPARLEVGAHFQVYCREDRDEAVRDGCAAIRRYGELNSAARRQGSATLAGRDRDPPEELIATGRVCIGTPDDCVAILRNARDYLGLSEVDCTFYFGGLDYAKARRSFELFAHEVMPRVSPTRVEEKVLP